MTATKTEKPILFSTELVQAILDGRKTQTRRVIKPQPISFIDYEDCGDYKRPMFEYDPEKSIQQGWKTAGPLSPYGWNGDELWVRETFCKHPKYNTLETKPGHCIYRADKGGDYQKPDHVNWKPSIFMPRTASRIQLTVTDICVERVQEMSAEDMEAEGITGKTEPSALLGKPNNYYQNGDGLKYNTPTEAWVSLWDSINADRGYSWESNPWVWVVDFEIKNIKG